MSTSWCVCCINHLICHKKQPPNLSDKNQQRLISLSPCMSAVDGWSYPPVAVGCLWLQLWLGLCLIWLFSMSLHFGIQANGPVHLGCDFLQAEIKKQEQASQISSCLEQAPCHFCWHSLANQVHGQVWQWAERCAPSCRSHGQARRMCNSLAL